VNVVCWLDRRGTKREKVKVEENEKMNGGEVEKSGRGKQGSKIGRYTCVKPC